MNYFGCKLYFMLPKAQNRVDISVAFLLTSHTHENHHNAMSSNDQAADYAQLAASSALRGAFNSISTSNSTHFTPTSCRASATKYPISEPPAFSIAAEPNTRPWKIQPAAKLPLPVSQPALRTTYSSGLSTLWVSDAVWLSSTRLVSRPWSRISRSLSKPILPTTRTFWASRPARYAARHANKDRGVCSADRQ